MGPNIFFILQMIPRPHTFKLSCDDVVAESVFETQDETDGNQIYSYTLIKHILLILLNPKRILLNPIRVHENLNLKKF